MTQLTSKELTMISDALLYESLICKKARAYAKSLTDVDLATCLNTVADDHQFRFEQLLAMIGG